MPLLLSLVCVACGDGALTGSGDSGGRDLAADAPAQSDATTDALTDTPIADTPTADQTGIDGPDPSDDGNGDDTGADDLRAADTGRDDTSRDIGGTDSGHTDDGADTPGDDPGLDLPDPPDLVDASTLNNKIVMGYQGWFAAPGDGSEINNWRHWSPGAAPTASNVTFDAWPDLRELGPAELFDTTFIYDGGASAGLYSAYTQATVVRHFAWMAEYGIDGVMLQHFVVELGEGSASREFRDRVMVNVRTGAEAHGRVFAVMYDISGASPDNLVARIQGHWQTLVDTGVVGSGRYLRHGGRPLVAIWGLGFVDRPGTPAQANELLDWFQSGAAPAYRATVLGGVPSRWRFLDGNSQGDEAWAAVYRRYDIISPWSVGGYANDVDIQSFRSNILAPDIVAATAAGAEYLPVVWPGFSWYNLMDDAPFNQIPRRGGQHFWTQVYEFVDSGATMLYGAMFDEVDEATAFFKIAETAADTPTTGQFLTLDADGEALPSDFYLRLAGEAGRVLRGERANQPGRPIGPDTLECDPPHSVEVDGRCVPSCGAAGGNSCDPTACAGRPPIEAHDCDICCAL